MLHHALNMLFDGLRISFKTSEKRILLDQTTIHLTVIFHELQWHVILNSIINDVHSLRKQTSAFKHFGAHKQRSVTNSKWHNTEQLIYWGISRRINCCYALCSEHETFKMPLSPVNLFCIQIDGVNLITCRIYPTRSWCTLLCKLILICQ